MQVFDPTQGFNAFTAGAQLGGSIRQRQTEAKLAPMVASGDYQGAAQYAASRGDLPSAELYRTQYGEQLKNMKAEELAAAQKRAETLARTAAGLRNVPYEQRRAQLQQQMPILQQMGLTPEQIAQFDPTDEGINAVLAQVTPLADLLKSPEYFAPTEIMTEDGPQLAQFSKGGGAPTMSGVTPYQKPEDQFEQYYENGRLMQRNSRTGQVSQVYAPPSGGIRIGPDGSVQIGGPVEGLGYGSAPKGQDAAIAFDPQGKAIVTPGPQQQDYNKAQNFLRSKNRTINIVRDDIARARELVEDPYATGPIGAVSRALPVVGAITPGGRLASRIKTIKTNIGFDKLAEMRETSPTGGALGNVSNIEIDFLQSVAGELDNAQTDEDVDYVLRRIDNFYADLQDQYATAFAADYPSLATTAQRRAGAKTQVQELNDLYEFMTPEERALFEGGQ